MTLPQAVLLDRDGTVNVLIEGDYVRAPDQLELLPGAAEAIGRLNAAQIPVYLVTNQRGIARGLMTETDLASVHSRLAELLCDEGAHLDGIYACPHDHGECDCRKPLTGLARKAAKDHGLDLTRCLVIGDGEGDEGMARAIGAPVVRVGNGVELSSAVDMILGRADAAQPFTRADYPR